MALKLKPNKTFEDSHGNIYEEIYGVIDQNNGNKRERVQHFTFEIYKDHQARIDKKEPVFSQSYDVYGEEFDTYFAPSVIANDRDHYHQAYIYLLNVKKNIGTEEEPDMVKVWQDLESDEVF